MTLQELHAKLTLLAPHLTSRQLVDVGLALNRLATECGAREEKTAGDCADALRAAHRHLAHPTRPAAEAKALEALLALPEPPPALTAAVAEERASLADAAAAVELQVHWSEKRRRDHRMALATYAQVLEPGRPPEAIAASEAAVAKRLGGVPATRFGVTKRTFDNLRGRLLAAVRLVDPHARRRLKMTSIPSCWREPLEALSPPWRRALWPLVTHAVFRGLTPAEVDAATLDALEAALARRGDAQPRLRVQRVVYACERLPTGYDTLAALPRRYSPRAASPLGWEELPQAFRHSWERWCGDELARLRAVAPSREEPDYADLFEDGEQLFAHLFDGGGDVEGTGLDDAPSRFRAAVTYAAKADAAPERLTDFREVLTPRHQQNAVAAVLARQQRRRAPHEPRVEKRNNYAWSVAGALYQLAKWHGVDEQDLADMRLVVLDVDPKVAKLRRDPATGRTRAVYRRGASVMGERHRRQLEAIVDSDAAFAAWVEAPDRLWAPVERAIARERVTVRLAYDALVACAHEYIRSAPTRLENFAELRVSGPRQNLRLTAPAEVFLHRAELKYGSDDMVIPLTGPARAKLEAFVRHCRPALLRHVGASPDNPWLVPAGGDGAKLVRSVGALFKARNRRLGFELGFHVGRHLGAWVLLEAGEDLAFVSAILGHRSVETTRRYYALLDRKRDLKRYQALLGAQVRRRGARR